MEKPVYRIIDANFNRAKEALRVCEDVARFFLGAKKLSARYKTSRHELTKVVESLKIAVIIDARDIKKDVGKASLKAEFKRRDVNDVFYANSQRSKESLRVLEEFIKLDNAALAQKIKRLRYKIYDLERETIKKL